MTGDTRKRRIRAVSMFGVVPPTLAPAKEVARATKARLTAAGDASPSSDSRHMAADYRLQGPSDWKPSCEQSRCS